MTPQDAADTIVEKFLNAEYGIIKEYIPMATKFATACAIIHCNEFIKVFNQWPEPRDVTIQLELDEYKAILKILKSK